MALEEPQVSDTVPPKLSQASPSGRINVIATEELLQRVEEWRAAQRPIPNKSEAARMLIERGLEMASRKPISTPSPQSQKGEGER